MKFYNVHLVRPENMERVLNQHIEKGYALRGWRNGPGQMLQLIFERDFATTIDRDRYREAQEQRRHARHAEREAVKAAVEGERVAAEQPAA